MTSGIPANAIVQIRTHYGQCVNHNSLGTGTWDYLTGRPTLPNDPTIRITWGFLAWAPEHSSKCQPGSCSYLGRMNSNALNVMSARLK